MYYCNFIQKFSSARTERILSVIRNRSNWDYNDLARQYQGWFRKGRSATDLYDGNDSKSKLRAKSKSPYLIFMKAYDSTSSNEKVVGPNQVDQFDIDDLDR